MVAPRVRADLGEIPDYRPGRPSLGAGPAYKLSSNENPYPPLPGVMDAVAQAAGGINRYPDMAATELVDALAAHLAVPAEDVVLGPGSVGVLQQVVAALAGPGDEVVFAWRSFEAYPIVTRVAGATPVPVGLTPDGRHDVDAMAAAVTDRTRVVLVCSPNNPTGPVVTADELDRLLVGVPSDVLVVVDEAYVEFVRDPSAADGLAAYREHANVAVLRTFSKAYGLAGLRVGFGVVKQPVAAAVRKTAIPFGVSSPAQAAAVCSLGLTTELMARVEALVAERERVVTALARQGWSLADTQANFVWLPLGAATRAFSEACTAAGLAVRAFEGDGVRVTIGEVEANDLLLSVAASFA